MVDEELMRWRRISPSSSSQQQPIRKMNYFLTPANIGVESAYIYQEFHLDYTLYRRGECLHERCVINDLTTHQVAKSEGFADAFPT